MITFRIFLKNFFCFSTTVWEILKTKSWPLLIRDFTDNVDYLKMVLALDIIELKPFIL